MPELRDRGPNLHRAQTQKHYAAQFWPVRTKWKSLGVGDISLTDWRRLSENS
jgi:hypothetical protein